MYATFILVRFLWNLVFLDVFSKSTYKHQISWKSFQLDPSFTTRKDRQTDRQDETNSGFTQVWEVAYIRQYTTA
jgi:hypothetical protein